MSRFLAGIGRNPAGNPSWSGRRLRPTESEPVADRITVGVGDAENENGESGIGRITVGVGQILAVGPAALASQIRPFPTVIRLEINRGLAVNGVRSDPDRFPAELRPKMAEITAPLATVILAFSSQIPVGI